MQRPSKHCETTPRDNRAAVGLICPKTESRRTVRNWAVLGRQVLSGPPVAASAEPSCVYQLIAHSFRLIAEPSRQNFYQSYRLQELVAIMCDAPVQIVCFSKAGTKMGARPDAGGLT